MDLEIIVGYINEVLRAAGQPEITVQQYQERLQSEDSNIKLHNAGKEAARRAYVRNALLKKYPISVKTPLSRCYYNLMKEEKSPEDEAYNRGIVEKLNSREGVCEMTEDIIRQAAGLPLSVYFPKDDAEMCSNYEKYGPIMDTLWNIKLMKSDLATYGVSLSPEVEHFLDSNTKAFESLNQQGSQVRKWGSPYYPYLNDEKYYNFIMKASSSSRPDKNAEMDVLRTFASDFMAEQAFDEKDKAFNKGGQILLENGQLDDYTYLSENLYETASSATKDTKLPKPDGDAKKTLDEAFKGSFVIDKIREELKRMPEYRAQLENGRWAPELQDEISEQTANLNHLFGPEFQFDEKRLQNGTYTKEVFKVNNYTLPKNSPFTEKEAALIGLAAFALPGIGDESRTDQPKETRINTNFGMVAENLLFGSPRHGLGNLVHPSVDLARKAIVPLISQYTEGQKRPLAHAIASGIERCCAFINDAEIFNKNALGNASAVNEYMGMLNKDPELMELVKKSKILTENHFKLAKLSSQYVTLYREKQEALKKYYDEIGEGKIPSAEIKKDLALKSMALDIMNVQKNKAKSEYMRQPETAARIAESQKIYRDNQDDPAAQSISQFRMQSIQQAVPVSRFLGDVSTPEGMRELEKVIESSREFNELIHQDEAKFIDTLQLGNSNDPRSGSVCKNVLKELNGKKALQKFEDSIFVRDPFGSESVFFDPKTETAALTSRTDAVIDAQKSVRGGSEQYNNVQKDLEMLKAGSSRLQADPNMTFKRVHLMRKGYSQLVSDCKAYLERKQKQGRLNADPGSKTGKRIAAVRSALEFGSKSLEAFEKMEKNVTKETAKDELKRLTDMAAANHDPETGKKIVSEIKKIGSTMIRHNLSPRQCGLNETEAKQLAVAYNNGGVAKAVQPQKANSLGLMK